MPITDFRLVPTYLMDTKDNKWSLVNEHFAVDFVYILICKRYLQLCKKGWLNVLFSWDGLTFFSIVGFWWVYHQICTLMFFIFFWRDSNQTMGNDLHSLLKILLNMSASSSFLSPFSSISGYRYRYYKKIDMNVNMNGESKSFQKVWKCVCKSIPFSHFAYGEICRVMLLPISYVMHNKIDLNCISFSLGSSRLDFSFFFPLLIIAVAFHFLPFCLYMCSILLRFSPIFSFFFSLALPFF